MKSIANVDFSKKSIIVNQKILNKFHKNDDKLSEESEAKNFGNNSNNQFDVARYQAD